MPSGGSRQGAGRPTSIAIIESRQLQAQITAIANQLGTEGPEILALAIDAAKAGDSQMQRFLLQLLFAISHPTSDDDTPLHRLYNQWSGRGGLKELHLHQHLHGDKDNDDSRQAADNDPGAAATGHGHIEPSQH